MYLKSILSQRIPPGFFSKKAPEIAPLLLGKILLRSYRGKWIGGMICETEAYSQEEPASHCYRGQTVKNSSMFGDPGTLYIYRSYGIHWCLNIKSGSRGYGEGVLIRALEPLFGLEFMRHWRGLADAKEAALCNGPGKLTEAMGIGGTWDGQLIGSGELSLCDADITLPNVIAGARIGISRGRDLMWRFGIQQHRCLSKPFPRVTGR